MALKKCKCSRVALLMILLAPASFRANSDVYKWVDEQGKTHYGAKPSAPEAQEIPIKDGAPNLQQQLSILKSQIDAQKYREDMQKYERERLKRKEKCAKNRVLLSRYWENRYIAGDAITEIRKNCTE